MPGADGNTRKQSQSRSPSANQPQPATPTAPVQFTFIHQHSDLESVQNRQIKNDDHRHAIRSHVMRNVRLAEHNMGKKRPTGRTPARAKSRDRRTSTTSTADSTAPVDDAVSDRRVAVKRESPSIEELTAADNSMLVRTDSHPTPPLYTAPEKNFYFDPFGQHPGRTLSQAATNELLTYGFSHFLPMTFPVEAKQTNEREARKALVLTANIAHPATFSGFLATIACHRAILFRRYKDNGVHSIRNSDSITDPDYRKAHHDCITATRIKIKKQEFGDQDFLEACFALISATTIVGDFQEARTHMEFVQRALKTVKVPESAAAWLPLADIKAALGVLDRPRIELPWPRTPLERATRERVKPQPGSQSSRMTTGFDAVTTLSPQLRELISDGAIICHMCEFNEMDSLGLTDREHIIFRCRSLDLEHDLLKYVFDIYLRKDGVTLDIPPIEDVVRLAILGILSTIAVNVLPGCGLGRALTNHQMKATERWFEKEKEIQSDIATWRTMTWALFVFVLCADDQCVEMEVFKQMLWEMSRRLWLGNWEEVENTVAGFLYVKCVQGPGWRKVWDDIERWIRREREVGEGSEIRGPGR